MTIDGIRKKIRSVILTAIDWAEKEGMTDGYLDLHIDEILNTEIVPERECEWCDGKGVRQEVDLHCVTCNGTGKLPPITVEQAIKKAQEGNK